MDAKQIIYYFNFFSIFLKLLYENLSNFFTLLKCMGQNQNMIGQSQNVWDKIKSTWQSVVFNKTLSFKILIR